MVVQVVNWLSGWWGLNQAHAQLLRHWYGRTCPEWAFSQFAQMHPVGHLWPCLPQKVFCDERN